MKNIWLASASPRRKQLLEWCGFEVDVHPSDIDERVRNNEAPIEYALRMAREKSVFGPPDRIVLTADTIVHLDDIIYGKPKNRQDAHRILSELSGAWHTVTTAVAINGPMHSELFHVDTRVRLRELLDDDIHRYLATGEADDKAGAYGIQGAAGAFIAELQGSWTNVMGLPTERVVQILRGLHS